MAPTKLARISYQQTSNILSSTQGSQLSGQEDLWGVDGENSRHSYPRISYPGSQCQGHVQVHWDGCLLSIGASLVSLGPFFWAHLPGSREYFCWLSCWHMSFMLWFEALAWWRMSDWGGIGRVELWARKVEFFSHHQTQAEPWLLFGSRRLKANQRWKWTRAGWGMREGGV